MLRSVAEIAVGVGFAAGAVFNSVYTLRHSTEFYGAFADGAWLKPADWSMRRVVIPNSTLYHGAAHRAPERVAIAILTRGELAEQALRDSNPQPSDP